MADHECSFSTNGVAYRPSGMVAGAAGPWTQQQTGMLELHVRIYDPQQPADSRDF